MDFLVSALADLIDELAKELPQWSFFHDFAADVAALEPYWQKANTLFPVDTLMEILALVIGLELVLVAFYWITRVINLFRGAG